MSILLSPHFTFDELKCPCCGKATMDPRFMIMLESLRVQFDKPIKINSAFRCPDYNAKLADHSPTSKHLIGCAADIAVSASDDRYKLLSLAFNIGFNGIGIGKNFIHVDSRLDARRVWVYN